MKEIHAIWASQGKRRKLVGWQASYAGRTLPTLFDTEQDARAALDAYAFRSIKSQHDVGASAD